MEGLQHGLETAFVGLFALSWIILLMEFLLPGRLWAIREFIRRPRTTEFSATLVSILVLPPAFLLGSIISRVADETFNKSWGCQSATASCTVPSDSDIRRSAYWDNREYILGAKAPPGLTSVVSVFDKYGQRYDVSGHEPFKAAVRRLYQYHKNYFLQKATSYLVLDELKDIITVLRGVTFNAVLVTLLGTLALLRLIIAIGRLHSGWMKVLFTSTGHIFIPLLISVCLVIIFKDADSLNMLLFVAFVIVAAVLVSLAAGYTVLRQLRVSDRRTNRDVYRHLQKLWFGSASSSLITAVGIVLMIFAYWGWAHVERNYDLQALRFYWASAPSEVGSRRMLTFHAESRYAGACDASAAVFVAGTRGTRFIAATDDDNMLRVYSVPQPSSADIEQPTAPPFNLANFLVPGHSKKEADIEAATAADGIMYWIGSHGRDSQGRNPAERRVLFGLRATLTSDRVQMEPIGKPYRAVIERMYEYPRIRQHFVDEAGEFKPLDIEGLASGRDGTLLIGFRRPLTASNKAIIIRLQNPSGVLKGAEALFGDPIECDLGGLGMRIPVMWATHSGGSGPGEKSQPQG